MEILLYNIVKFLQSPINKNINVSFLAPLNMPFKDKGNNLNDIFNSLFSNARGNNVIPNLLFSTIK